MRALHLDCFSGMAGNMFMGAMLDLGLPRRALLEVLGGLDLDFKLVAKRVHRGALAARYVDVRVPRAARPGRKKAAKKSAGHPGHAHGDHAHSPGHAGHHTHAGARTYRQIDALLRRAELSSGVRERARDIFRALAEAEARVHGTKIEAVHFHEVGAVDAIVDVTAAAAALELLGIGRVSSTSVALGHGHVHTDHGVLPLPAPATLELLRGIPTHPTDVPWETVTPTGAAILRCIVDDYGPLPAMRVDRVGYGAGNDRKGPMPNCVRAILGEPEGGPLRDRICCLETNIDDLVPEHFDYLMEKLQGAGALDVSLQHIQMKKNRPGFLVRVLARPADRQTLAAVLFAESSAIGVRSQEWDRLVLRREARRVDTPYGRIRVKAITGPGGDVRCSAEYDDCRKAAAKAGVPLRQVVKVAERLAEEG